VDQKSASSQRKVWQRGTLPGVMDTGACLKRVFFAADMQRCRLAAAIHGGIAASAD